MSQEKKCAFDYQHAGRHHAYSYRKKGTIRYNLIN